MFLCYFVVAVLVCLFVCCCLFVVVCLFVCLFVAVVVCLLLFPGFYCCLLLLLFLFLFFVNLFLYVFCHCCFWSSFLLLSTINSEFMSKIELPVCLHKMIFSQVLKNARNVMKEVELENRNSFTDTCTFIK